MHWASGERVLIALSAATTAFILGRIWYVCGYGFDYTDEGYYLNWIAHPFGYETSITQFGFAYHALYLLTDGSVAAVRRLNLLGTALLGALLAAAWLRHLFAAALQPATRRAVAAALATLVALYGVIASEWLPTPSYNSLALQGLLAGATGLLLAGRERSPRSLAGWALLATGLWLAFLAKPTTAALFGVIALLQLWAAGQWRTSLAALAAAIFLALLLATALAVDQSVPAFIERYRAELALGSLLRPQATLSGLLRLESMDLNRAFWQPVLLLTAGTAAGVGLLQWRPARWPGAGMLAGAVVAVLAVGGAVALPAIPVPARNLLVVAPAVGALLAALVLMGADGWRRLARREQVRALALLALPYAYAFGTTNNYWVQIGCASLFAVLAALALVGPLAPRPALGGMLLVTGLALQLTVLALVEDAFKRPYRQSQPLLHNDTEVPVGGGTLTLAPADAAYIRGAQAAAAQGLRPGMPMIDLSGASPGLLYALGARSVGTAWTLGGYPGSARFVTQVLARVPCQDLASAWVLSSPENWRRLPPEVLASFGADLGRDYTVAGRFTAPGAGAQFLNQPARPADVARRACEEERRRAG